MHLNYAGVQTLLHHRVWHDLNVSFSRTLAAVTLIRLLNVFNLFISVLLCVCLPTANFWQFVFAAAAVACGVQLVRDVHAVWRAWKG